MSILISRTVVPGFWAVLFLTMIANVGCGSVELPDLADVSGTVQMDGRPLADAQVLFVPANGRPSSATTDSNGSFTMVYSEHADGVVPGTCRVMISTGKAGKENEDGTSVPAIPETVPMEYNVDTSLTFDVKPGTSNVADFKLTGNGQVAAAPSGEDSAPDSGRGGKSRESGE